MAVLTDQQKREAIEAQYRQSKPQFPGVQEVLPEELEELRRQDEGRVVVVDVRGPEERKVSMIPGAVSSEEFEQRSEEFQDATIVVYCTVGHRSGLYAQKLDNQGWRVFNLKGAILAWTHIGGPLADARGPTRRVHVPDRRWRLAADGYESVW